MSRKQMNLPLALLSAKFLAWYGPGIILFSVLGFFSKRNRESFFVSFCSLLNVLSVDESSTIIASQSQNSWPSDNLDIHQ